MSTNEEHGYVYVVVRNDLSNAQKAVQSAHACIEVAREWVHGEHPSVIIVVVKNENKLNKLVADLDGEVDIKVFKEPDIGYQTTAIATKPLYGEERKRFSKYQLLQ
jgi:hypothetical protein